jgi:hypothetical protein
MAEEKYWMSNVEHFSRASKYVNNMWRFTAIRGESF